MQTSTKHAYWQLTPNTATAASTTMDTRIPTPLFTGVGPCSAQHPAVGGVGVLSGDETDGGVETFMDCMAAYRSSHGPVSVCDQLRLTVAHHSHRADNGRKAATVGVYLRVSARFNSTGKPLLQSDMAAGG